MLEACSLTKDYGAARAVDSVSLRVAPGEVFCLLGANGAGKTTMVKMFLGLVRPTAGRALVGGLDALERTLEARRLLAYIPEQISLYPSLSGVENLEYFSALGGVAKSRAELEAALSGAGLPQDAVHRPLSSYSKGMRQKVAVAMAVAKEAKALVLDEPTSGLDPQAANELSRLIRALAAGGAAVLMVTHDLFHAKETGTRVGIMKAGRLVETLGTAELGHADLEKLYLEHMRG